MKMTFQLGDFVCVPMHGDAGELIRIGQYLNGSGFKNFEHAEVLVTRNQTMGAYPGGAKLEDLAPLDYQQGWLWSSDAIGVHLTAKQRDAVVSTALALKGIGYSPTDYFALAAHRLDLPGASLLKNYVSSTNHMICSQLVDYCYLMAGVHLFNDGRWPGYVTPEDLANVIADPSGVTYG
jgi:hypothetical protein